MSVDFGSLGISSPGEIGEILNNPERFKKRSQLFSRAFYQLLHVLEECINQDAVSCSQKLHQFLAGLVQTGYEEGILGHFRIIAEIIINLIQQKNIHTQEEIFLRHIGPYLSDQSEGIIDAHQIFNMVIFYLPGDLYEHINSQLSPFNSSGIFFRTDGIVPACIIMPAGQHDAFYHEFTHLLHNISRLIRRDDLFAHFIDEAVAYVAGNEMFPQNIDMIFPAKSNIHLANKYRHVLYQLQYCWWQISLRNEHPHDHLLFALETSNDVDELLIKLAGLCVNEDVEEGVVSFQEYQRGEGITSNHFLDRVFTIRVHVLEFLANYQKNPKISFKPKDHISDLLYYTILFKTAEKLGLSLPDIVLDVISFLAYDYQATTELEYNYFLENIDTKTVNLLMNRRIHSWMHPSLPKPH